MRSKDEVLREVSDAYLNSGDFNGRFTNGKTYSAAEIDLVRELILEGSIEVVSEVDFVNPSIRPWPTRRLIEEQAKDLENLEDIRVCLYPTTAVLVQRQDVIELGTEPYRQAMASGRGQLELAFFECPVLEQYRNDPRYRYWFRDVEIHIGIGEDAYGDTGELERDKIGSVRVGIGYDMSTISSGAVVRVVCCFYRDLAELTPEHQQRWRTYEVERRDGLRPHPMWWAEMMGEWGDAIGPFQKIQMEMEAINELFVIIWGKELFKTTELPREWGWVLRPSTQEWHQFVQTTDKLLSDNLQHSALGAGGVARSDAQGVPLGSLQRLDLLLVNAGLTEHQADDLLAPLRFIRDERQTPAHKLLIPTTEPTLIARQRDVLGEIANSLTGIRRLLMSHASAAGWTPDDLIEGKWYAL